MADQLYLSYWIRGFDGRNMLRHFEQLLRHFPFSPQAPRASALHIYALEYSEPSLYEALFAGPDLAGEAAAAVRQFSGADCAWLLESWWDLWQHEQDWKLRPSPVVLSCFGPEFSNDAGDHLRVEVGAVDHYLPQPGLPGSLRLIQSNIRGLLTLARELDARLPVEKRLLWSDTGENFAERLQAALA